MRLVGYYSVATHLGGGERSLLELIRGYGDSQSGAAFRPWVILPRAEGPLVEALEKLGVELDVLPIPESFFKLSRGGAPLSAFQLGLRSVPGMSIYLARLGRLLRARAPALLHTNALKCHALGAVVSPALRIPLLWHYRDILSEGATLWTLRVLRRASGAHVVANSRATAEAFAPGDSRVAVIHNGIDAETYRPAPNRELHERLGVSPKRPMIGILGVLARWKGQLEFLRMAAELRSRGVDACFAVIGGEIYDTVGDQGYGRALRDEAERLGLGGDVLFAGQLPDPARAINGLDVLVHASVRPEPFGRVLIEGMACEVPVVASAAGGVLEIARNGETALLFRPGDPAGMADAVERLLLEPELARRLARAGRAEFLARFTREEHFRRMQGLYGRILA